MTLSTSVWNLCWTIKTSWFALPSSSSLADVKTPDAIKALETALNDEVAEASFAAAKALYALNNPEGKKALLAILEKESQSQFGFSHQREANCVFV